VLLLDNAQKFLKGNKKDKVRGDIRLLMRMEKQYAQFIVEDNGIGIPQAEAEHIFDEFVQLDEYYDGVGIGLTVARNLARRLKGDVILDTSYTDGARFIFSLPA